MARKNTGMMAVPATPDAHVSVSIRKIDNGYVASHSHSDGKGNYKSREVYHPTMPQIGVPAPAKAAAPKSPVAKAPVKPIARKMAPVMKRKGK